MERETKTISLPKTKAEVIIYTYITAKEKRQITDVMLKAGSVDLATSAVKGDIPLSAIYEANDKAMSFLVISINGEKDNIKETIDNLPATDSDYLFAEVNKITQDTDFLAESQK